MGQGYEEFCSMCGKRFYIGDRDNYAYQRQRAYYDGKHSIKWFCSWHCLRAEELEHERQKEKRRQQYAKRKAIHK